MDHAQTATDASSPLFPPGEHARMLDIVVGAARCQAAYCAARFSLAEHLAAGPTTARAIATAEGLDPDATFRLLRACAAFGLTVHDGGDEFAGTPLLATLRRDDPESLHGSVLSMLGHGFGLLRGPLDVAVKTGRPQITETIGSSTWDYYATEAGAAEGRAFAQAMAATARRFNAAVVDAVDTAGARYAVDVGGADGGWVRALLRANPLLRGGVLDLAVEAAAAAAQADQLGDRFRSHAGDFFTAVPPADLYLLKWVLHDWPDEACLKILENCRRASMPGGRLLVAEMTLDEATPAPFAAAVDLNMLVTLGGRERTFAEYAGLLTRAGFRDVREMATVAPFSIIGAAAG